LGCWVCVVHVCTTLCLCVSCSQRLIHCTTRRPKLQPRSYAGRPGAEAEFAVALWWRASALQALSAYALGVISKGLVADPQAQVGVGLV
jgi:hypothetical protein